MPEPYQEAQAEVVRAILADLKFASDRPIVLRQLVDEIGLYVNCFSSPAIRNFYEASLKAYIASAPNKLPITFGAVLTELESLGDPNTEVWKKKYAEIENKRYNHLASAKALMNHVLRGEVVNVTEEWLEIVRKPASDVREEISAFVSMLVNLSTDGHAESRPDKILEAAWQSGICDPEPTGFDALNQSWDGGFKPKNLITVGMPSGGGKSSSCVSFICERVRQGRYSLLHSFEQPKEELLFKAMANLSCLTLEQVEKPNELVRSQDEWDSLMASKDLLGKYVRVYDTQCKLPEIAMRVRRHQAEFGPKMDWMAVDHIGALGMAASDNWSRDLEQTASFFKQSICKPYNICTLMYSQVDAKTESEMRLKNKVEEGGLRGSRGIYMASDVVVYGCRHNGIVREGKASHYDNAYRAVTVFQTDKSRRTGHKSIKALQFDPEHHRLLNKELPV